MKIRKFLRVSGMLEIALALIMGLLAFIRFRGGDDYAALSEAGGAKFWVLLVLALIFPVIRLIGGIIGMIGRGKSLMTIFGVLMIVGSAPSMEVITNLLKNEINIPAVGLSCIALIVSVLYLIGALIYKKPEKHKKGEPHYHIEKCDEDE